MVNDVRDYKGNIIWSKSQINIKRQDVLSNSNFVSNNDTPTQGGGAAFCLE